MFATEPYKARSFEEQELHPVATAGEEGKNCRRTRIERDHLLDQDRKLSMLARKSIG